MNIFNNLQGLQSFISLSPVETFPIWLQLISFFHRFLEKSQIFLSWSFLSKKVCFHGLLRYSNYSFLSLLVGFSGSSDRKESACNKGDLDSNPGLIHTLTFIQRFDHVSQNDIFIEINEINEHMQTAEDELR